MKFSAKYHGPTGLFSALPIVTVGPSPVKDGIKSPFADPDSPVCLFRWMGLGPG